MWLSSLSLCLCLCVYVFICCDSNPDWSLCAGGAAIFNICVSLPQPRESICERTASQKLPNGFLSSLFPIWAAYLHRGAFPSSSSRDIEPNIRKKRKARGKEAMTGCWIRAHMCQHTVSITFCFDLTPPRPLTPTPLVWPPRDSQHSEVTQEVINQTQWDQGTPFPIAFFFFQKKSSAGLQAVFADAF